MENAHNKKDLKHDYSDLVALERQKEEAKLHQSAKQPLKDLSDIRDFVLRLQKQLTELEIDHQRLKVDKIEWDYMSYLQYQKTKRRQRLTALLRPRIGVLTQYGFPREIHIPKRYRKPIKLKKAPSISIVTPSLNQGHFLEKTILSVIEQQYPALEYLIQDGGSTDNSIELIKEYKSHLKSWESKEDNGQSHALNLGFQRTSGEIMAYLNSDDILLPGTLNYVAKYFAEHPDVDVIYGHRVLINEYNLEIGLWIMPPHNSEILKWVDYIPQETLFWRRSIWEKVGGKIDEDFKFAMDWDLLLRFQKAGARFVRLPRFLGGFRVHSQQKTSSGMTSIGEKEIEILRKRSLGRPVSKSEIDNKVHWHLMHHLLLHRLYRLKLLRY